MVSVTVQGRGVKLCCWVALWIANAALGTACVGTPRAKTDLAHRTDAIEFSGLFEVPGVELAVQAKNQRTQSWVRFATAVTRAEDPVIGQSGSPYFRYSVSAVVPQHPDYWLPHRESRRIEAQVRVVYGERVLAVFDTDAESCARRAQARGTPEREALDQCASDQQGVARLFVASCGGLGEPCCPRAPAADSCNGGFSCGANGVCEKADYPLPFVKDYQVDLPLSPGFSLRDAWLVLDDREHGPDSVRPLVEGYVPHEGVQRELPHPNMVRLRFDLSFWKPGKQRVFVRGSTVKGDQRKPVESAPQLLEYSVPRQLGFLSQGRFQLPAAHFPRLMRDCHGPGCKDADGDGQNDLWENVAVEQLRPRLMLDEKDGLFERSSDSLRVLSSVLPVEHGGESYVLFANVIAFSRDYGHMGAFDHPGDTEAFGMLFRVDETDTLSWVASAAKGHACLTCTPRFNFLTQEFADDGSPLLYVERNKHGLWQNGRACREHSAFSCRGERSLRPDALNVGDPSADGSSGLVDGLDGLAPNGPFAQLAGVFPGEAVWTAERARVPGRFCGGRAGCNGRRSANQPGNVISNLLSLFQREVLDSPKLSRQAVQ